uniref:RNA exonuclease 1 homolog n=1 Tax=Sphenodon punctatus TaxID=8508 RepID=A0A8D0HAC0_SPHPU
MNKYLHYLLIHESSELGYDPYNPELPSPSAHKKNGALDAITESAPSILELELVNKAIEAAQNEVEREQKKYEELLETTKEYSTSEASSLISKTAVLAAVTKVDSFTTFEYNPGNYNLNNNADYNPTPLAAASSNKYILDSFDDVKSKGNSLEYVPKAIAQSKKYTSALTNNKYVIDKSKPSTDLEYDPLSNYSARLLSKARTKEQKGTKRKRGSGHGDSYSPASKKHCSVTNDYETTYARFSDSEDDRDLERQPSSASCLKSKDSSEIKSSDELTAKENCTKLADTHSRRMKETAVQYDVEDIENVRKNLVEDSPEKDAGVAAKASSSKNEKERDDKSSREALKDKVKNKRTDGNKCSSHKNASKKEKSKNGEREKLAKKEKGKIKNGEKNGKEKSVKIKTEGSLKKPEKQKLEKSGADKRENSKSVSSGKSKQEGLGKGSGMEKPRGDKRNSKLKTADLRNGKQTSGSKNKGKGDKMPVPERPKMKKSRSVEEGNSKGKCKPKQRTLSHVDLFGDESGDEENEVRPLPTAFPDVSSDSDGDGCSGFQSDNEGTKSVKRSRLSKAPPPSSSSDDDDVDYSVLEKDLDDESDPMEECLRIFNESTDVKTEDKGRLGKQPPKEEGSEEKTEDNLTTLFPGQKRRISRLMKQGNVDVPAKPVIRPYRPPTAQEVCYRRIQLAQQQAAKLAVAAQKCSLALPGEKKRIAHVPNAALSTAAKPTPVSIKKPTPVGSVKSSNGFEASAATLKARTLAGMASKTTTTSAPRRMAHVPSLQSASLKRPMIPTEFGSKVPTNIRQRYLNFFIDECLKFCSSAQEAFDKALSEEKVAYDRSTSRSIYLNVAVNTLKKLRSLTPSTPPPANKASNRKVVSHEAVLGGKLAAKTSFTINRSGSLRAEDLTGAALYRRLKEYVLTEEQLKENSYPMPHPEKLGRAVVFAVEEKRTTDSLCRVCCRCGTEYMVSTSGNCIRKEECVHHWGRLRKQKVRGGWEAHYSCCAGAVGSPGCQVAKQHVQDGRKESLEGFVKTFEKLPPSEGYPGIYALDCEMCYTKQGLELTRVTVINSDLKVVYDTFVQPDTKVVDYNTRFSGVTEADLENTCITLRDVQAVLLNMFSADTILIGHSLESDLFALKLIHCTVVDTAVVFPHRLGMPYKRALRTLMADYLKRIIQDSVEGHDSSEDAGACMELMIWKIKEDAKVKR